MDANRFDRIARTLGEQRDRRGVVKVAAGGALGLLGAGALGRTVLGQDLEAESRGYKGDDCDVNRDCRKGLICDTDNFTCQYRKNCGGGKGHACQGTPQCCRNRGLTCVRKKCRRR
jgi:hypothetical protein